MHSLNKKHFGPSSASLSIRYWNGATIVNGYIIRQLGEAHYIVTDGVNIHRVSLAKTTQLAQYCNGAAVPGGDYAIIDGLGTVVAIKSGTHYIHKITSKLAYTTEGAVDRWAINSAPNGEFLLTGNALGSAIRSAGIASQVIIGATVYSTFVPVSDFPLHLIVDGDSIMTSESSVTGQMVEAIGDIAIKIAGYNNATGGHDRFDIRDGLTTPIGLMRNSTLFVMGPIGANNGTGGTVAEHRATYFEIGDAIVASPKLKKMVWIPTLPDKTATGVTRVQRKIDLANITRTDMVARYGSNILVPNTTGFDPETMKTDDTHPNRLRGQIFLAQSIEDAVRPIYSSQLATSYTEGVNKIASGDWNPDTWAGTGTGWTKTNSGADVDGPPWVEWSISNASAISTLTLTRSVVENGSVGDVNDFLCEIEFVTTEATPGDAKYLGIEAVLGAGRTAGQANGSGIFLPVPTRRIYPRTLGSALTVATTDTNAQVRVKVDAGGSLTFRMRRPQVRFWFNAMAVLTVQGAPPARAQVGRAINFAPVINGGTAPYTVTMNSAIDGLTVNATTGEITGSPTLAGIYSGRVLTITDALGATTTLSYPSLEVIVAGAPWNTEAPSISPTPPRVAATATTTNGTWDNNPASFEYRWLVDGNTGELAAQTGATTTELPTNIQSSLLASEVRATNASGTGHWVRSVEQQIGAAVGDTTVPTITSIASVSVAENSVLAHTLTANEVVSWTILAAGQNAASLDHDEFELSGTTLRFLTNGTRNFEGPTDTDVNNSYVVVVRATDGSSNFSEQTITVTVTDVVESSLPTWNNAVNFGNPAQLSYSNSDQTVSNNTNTTGARFARQSLSPGKTSGKWYGRVYLTGGGLGRGFGLATSTVGGSVGGTNGTTRWYWTGTTVFSNSANQPMTANISTTDGNYEVAFDLDANLAWFRTTEGNNWNNDILANQNPATGAGGLIMSRAGAAIFLMVSHPNNNTASSTLVAGTPPSGFTAL